MTLNFITDRHINDPDVNKRYYNVSDLNRVEANMVAVANLLESYGYMVNLGTTKDNWVTTEFFTTSEGVRYLQNLNKIIDAYHSVAPAPPVTMDNIDFTDANNIEKNLKSVYDIINESIKLMPTLAFTLGGEEI